jgi:uncharacterized protein (DUF1501 family)
LPRIFSGPAEVATIAKASKDQHMAIDKPIVAQGFNELYAGRKDSLGRAYSEAIAAHKEVSRVLSAPDDETMTSDQSMLKEQLIANKGAPTPRNYNQFGKQVAKLLRTDPSIQVAFLDFGGWDTHINEGTGKGQLANHLTPLANGLVDLISGIGPLYKNTTIVVMSEFGRTAKENGNAGTDHGHGNVLWLFGGDVGGGKVYGRWAGLDNNALHEARDLPTSTDFRSVLSVVLAEHLHVSQTSLHQVFPDFQVPSDPFVRA